MRYVASQPEEQFQRAGEPGSDQGMSKQLSIAAAGATLALSAFALLSPDSVSMAELPAQMGATMEIAAPIISLRMSDPLSLLPFLY